MGGGGRQINTKTFKIMEHMPSYNSETVVGLMADESQKITRGDIIRIVYDLWIKDDDILFETTHKELAEEQGITDEDGVYEPIPLIVDEGKAVKGLYDSILAAEVGKEYDIEVPPEEALGNRDPKLVEWHMMNEIRRQKLEPVVGEKITIKDKSRKERTGIAGKTLKYKYKIENRASKPVDKVATILEIDFGRKEEFEIAADNDNVDIKLPEVCKYDQFWLIAKFKVINDLREYAGFKTIRFIEEYVKKEEAEKEEGEESGEGEGEETDKGSEEEKVEEPDKESGEEEKTTNEGDSEAAEEASEEKEKGELKDDI
jgi:FKBP-type peptidyl-prolyl cis-trans isomerase 2